jgi:hypothetical protein
MRDSDIRGKRLAVVSHELMNAHLSDDASSVAALAALEELGFGLMSLPPAPSSPLRIEALHHLVDQLQDYLRHGYAAVVIDDAHAGVWLEPLDAALRAHGASAPRRIPVGSDFRAALAAVGTAGPV